MWADFRRTGDVSAETRCILEKVFENRFQKNLEKQKVLGSPEKPEKNKGLEKSAGVACRKEKEASKAQLLCPAFCSLEKPKKKKFAEKFRAQQKRSLS